MPRNQTMKNAKIKYSIIIPAYNAEKTIKRAINSVTRNLQNYEIIVVENGSTDNTTTVVSNLLRDNQRIHLLHSDKGISAARNTGIKSATGEWLIFVDADDELIVTQEEIDSLTDILGNADLIICSYRKDNRNMIHSYKHMNEILRGEDKEGACDWMLSRPTRRMTVWAKLYRREFVQDKRLLFDEDLRVSEDSEFLLRFMLECNTMAISELSIYRYCSDSPSVIRSIDTTRTEGYLKAVEKAKYDLEYIDEDFQDAFVEFTIAHLNLIGVHDVFNSDMKMSWKDRVYRIKEIVNQDIIRNEIDKLRIKNLQDINNIPAYLFKNKMYTLGGAMCYLRSVINTAQRKSKN